MMDQVWRRLQLLAAQGVATLVGTRVVQARVLDEELVKAQRIEPYGLSYMPKAGAEVYLVFPAGDRAQGLALVIGDRRYQVELQAGEVALHDDEGNMVKLGRGGVITIKANAAVNIEAPQLTHNGVNVGATHTHGGVAAGGARTSNPG